VPGGTLVWDNAGPCPAARLGAWLSLVERSLWERDVAGSNPVAPTNFHRRIATGLQRATPATTFRSIREGAQSKIATAAAFGVGLNLVLNALKLSFYLQLAVGVATLLLAVWWFVLHSREPRVLFPVAGHILLEAGKYDLLDSLRGFVGEAWHPRRAQLQWEPRNEITATLESEGIRFSRRSSDVSTSIMIKWSVLVYNRDLPLEDRVMPTFYRRHFG
jgi:hypothetical protein